MLAWTKKANLAQGLAGIGIGRGERVGIYMDRSINSLVGVFGILKAGAAYVPVDPMSPPGRLSYILNKCGIRSLITTREKLSTIERVFPQNSPLENILAINGLASHPGSLGSTRLFDWPEIKASARGGARCANSIDSDLAYILFTSGSTGNPKGVMISHLNSLTFVNAAHDFFRITANDRFSNICPLHFDMSVFDLFVAFKAGATVIIIPEITTTFPVKLAETIAKNRISVWNSVPSALSLLATYKNLDNHDLSSLRLVLFAGELFPLKYLRRLQETVPGARFCNLYGQTEANSSTYYWVPRVAADATASLPIGKALPNFEVFALDEEGKQIAKTGQEGELYVRASTVAKGYWDEAEKTEKAFVKTFFALILQRTGVQETGDLVQTSMPTATMCSLGEGPYDKEQGIPDRDRRNRNSSVQPSGS